MTYTLTETEIIDLLSRAVRIGIKKGMMIGQVAEVKLKPYLSKSEADQIYGRRNVERWIKNRLVRTIKDGDNNAKLRLDRMQLEIIAASSNRGF